MPIDLSPVKKYHPNKIEGRQQKRVLVEYLYLDLQVCDRCIGTEDVLDEVLTKLSDVMELAGYSLEYKKNKMETAEIAQQNHFVSSPTIRVNGQDVCFDVKENPCDCCSDISGSIVDCRIFEYEGRSYEVPPQEMLAEAVLMAIFGSQATPHIPENGYTFPKNLEVFYEGKETKSSCDCAGSCC